MPTDSVKEAIFATKQEREKLLVVGNGVNVVKSFKKSDFLNPEQFAKKFRFNKELVEKTMRRMAALNSKFVMNGHLSNIVIKTNENTLLAHPMAFEEIKKQLMKPKVKS
ncbi:MAG: hypothetical protein IKZ49_04775 [Alphaproteobacteria bacterium]|nr:hypothetical protein [Alphaproteobacteria bacterium]